MNHDDDKTHQNPIYAARFGSLIAAAAHALKFAEFRDGVQICRVSIMPLDAETVMEKIRTKF